MKESDLAEIIIKDLKSDGYEIYSEVLFKQGSKRADIVAVNDKEHMVIETKMSMNLKLIEQAFYWKDKVNRVFIFIPSKRKMNRFALKLCRDLGVGVYIYRKGEIVKLMESTICKDPDLPKLHEQQKESVSGSKGGGYVTPFSLTRQKFVSYINERGECYLSEAVKNIQHHYSSDYSARNALHKMVNTGVISEVEIFRKGKEVWIKLK